MRALTICFVNGATLGKTSSSQAHRHTCVAFSRVADQPGPDDGPEPAVDDHEIAGPWAETKYPAEGLENGTVL